MPNKLAPTHPEPAVRFAARPSSMCAARACSRRYIPNRAIAKPNPISEMPVRSQASIVRSLAWCMLNVSARGGMRRITLPSRSDWRDRVKVPRRARRYIPVRTTLGRCPASHVREAASLQELRKRKELSMAKPTISQRQPNVIFVMGDDIGWFNIGAYHQGIMARRTPNIDRLAPEGGRFTDYYAEGSWHRGPRNIITREV